MDSSACSTVAVPQIEAALPGDAWHQGPASAKARRLLEDYVALEEQTRWQRSYHPFRDRFRDGKDAAIYAAPREVQVAVARAVFDDIVRGKVPGSSGTGDFEHRVRTYFLVWDNLMGWSCLSFAASDLEPMMEVAILCLEAHGDVPGPLGIVAANIPKKVLIEVWRFAAARGLTPTLKAQLERLRRCFLARRKPYADGSDIESIDALLGPAQVLQRRISFPHRGAL